MVSLVIVSHSRTLAEGVQQMIRQMADEEVPIAIAAGAGDDRSELGTDATEIMEAIDSVYGDDGVLVLIDVGSALLSTEMALEFLDDERKANIRISAAPLVEGALSAAVQASLGSDIAAVYREAMASLDQKRDHLADLDVPDAVVPDEVAPSDDEKQAAPDDEAPADATITVTLPNEHGLHARPAARFVRRAGQFDADISVENVTEGKGPVSAKSISKVSTLGAVKGHELRLEARGAQAENALQALREMVEAGFGELDEDAPPESPSTSGEADREEQPVPSNGATADGDAPADVGEPQPDELHPGDQIGGLSIMDGYAVGPALVYEVTAPDVPDEPSDDPEADWERLQDALTSVKQEIEAEESKLSASVGEEAAGILGAQRLLLDDPDLMDDVRTRLFDSKVHVAKAWLDTVDELADSYGDLSSQYLRERATDIRDVGHRVARTLLDEPATPGTDAEEPSILVADELTPSDASNLDPDTIIGVVCAAGSATAHSAILLRTFGIPTVFGAGRALLGIETGMPLGLDATHGRVWIEPDADTREDLEEKRRQFIERQQQLQENADEPATTSDGHTIEVAANAAHPDEAQAAVDNGADGIGLLRTEFLFGSGDEPPSEDEQVERLRAVTDPMDGKPIIIRTLDVGGDKPLPYLAQPDEDNPFLGVRGIRLMLKHQDLFKAQLRAILRVGATADVHVMLPMVALAEEIEETRTLLEDAHRELDEAGTEHEWPMPLGIMIETPGAALAAHRLAEHVDFFSIGTNDLTQYTMAADRGSTPLAHLTDALHPPVLRLIGDVAEAAQHAGHWAGVCGEVAADPLAVPLLIGLGVTELSVRPNAVPTVKGLTRRIALSDAQDLADEALNAATADDARALSRSFINDHAPHFLEE